MLLEEALHTRSEVGQGSSSRHLVAAKASNLLRHCFNECVAVRGRWCQLEYTAQVGEQVRDACDNACIRAASSIRDFNVDVCSCVTVF